jgi:O-antigen ligase
VLAFAAPLLVVLVAGLLLGAFALGSASDALWRRRIPLAVATLLCSFHFWGVRFGPYFTAVHVAMTLLAGLWLLERVSPTQRPWRPSVFTMLNLLFIGAMLNSVLGRGALALRDLVRAVDAPIVALLLVDLLYRDEHFRAALRALVAGTAVSAVVGIGQACLHYFLHLDYSLATPEYRYMYVEGGAMLRATALHASANTHAEFLACASLVSLAVAASVAGRRHRSRWILAALLMWVALALTLARAAWFAVALGLLALPLVLPSRRRLRWAFATSFALAVVLLSGAGARVVKQAVELAPQSLEVRTALVLAGVRAMTDEPWRGVGLHNFAAVASPIERYPVHNTLIQLGSELGFPGLVLFLSLLSWSVMRLARALRAARDPERRAWLAALAAGLLPLGVLMQAQSFGYSEFLWSYLALGEVASRNALAGSDGSSFT